MTNNLTSIFKLHEDDKLHSYVDDEKIDMQIKLLKEKGTIGIGEFIFKAYGAEFIVRELTDFEKELELECFNILGKERLVKIRTQHLIQIDSGTYYSSGYRLSLIKALTEKRILDKIKNTFKM